jgi:hypothetical protein
LVVGSRRGAGVFACTCQPFSRRSKRSDLGELRRLAAGESDHRFVRVQPMTQAVREYRKALREARG